MCKRHLIFFWSCMYFIFFCSFCLISSQSINILKIQLNIPVERTAAPLERPGARPDVPGHARAATGVRHDRPHTEPAYSTVYFHIVYMNVKNEKNKSSSCFTWPPKKKKLSLSFIICTVHFLRRAFGCPSVLELLSPWVVKRMVLALGEAIYVVFSSFFSGSRSITTAARSPL